MFSNRIGFRNPSKTEGFLVVVDIIDGFKANEGLLKVEYKIHFLPNENIFLMHTQFMLNFYS